VLTLLPSWAMAWLGRRAVGRVNVACTNVPGVAEPRWIAGTRIEAIFPFASVVQGTPLVMALLSYAGTMEVGIDTDPEAIPDPEHIAQLFLAAVEELATLPAHSG
jgi:diacylglycerol O-acyltransferase